MSKLGIIGEDVIYNRGKTKYWRIKKKNQEKTRAELQGRDDVQNKKQRNVKAIVLVLVPVLWEWNTFLRRFGFDLDSSFSLKTRGRRLI